MDILFEAGFRLVRIGHFDFWKLRDVGRPEAGRGQENQNQHTCPRLAVVRAGLRCLVRVRLLQYGFVLSIGKSQSFSIPPLHWHDQLLALVQKFYLDQKHVAHQQLGALSFHLYENGSQLHEGIRG